MKTFFFRSFLFFWIVAIFFFANAAGAAETDSWQWLNPLPQANDLNGVWGISESNVFAVGKSGTILHYNGYRWHLMNSGTVQHLADVWSSSADNVFAVGDYGTILYYDGISWQSMNSGTTNYLSGIWGSDGNNIFAVAYRGFGSKVVFDCDEPVDTEVCRDCDECVSVCPTGALSQPAKVGRDREKPLVIRG